MGFSSWLCNYCRKSLLSSYVTGDRVSRDWSDAVVVLQNVTLRGEYDGYGHVADPEQGERRVTLEDSPRVYHAACYKLAGSPSYEDAPVSLSAPDQGYFINPEIYAGRPGLERSLKDEH